MTTRDALLKAAREEFAAYGVAGARVDRIAQNAGVNKERIYGYFGSKDKLFDAVVSQALAELTEAVSMPGDDPIDYVGKIYDFHQDHQDLTRLLMWEALHYRDADLPGQADRRAKCVRKSESLAAGLGREPSQEVAMAMFALVGLALFPVMMPQLVRLIAGDEVGREQLRDHLVAFAEAALVKKD